MKRSIAFFFFSLTLLSSQYCYAEYMSADAGDVSYSYDNFPSSVSDDYSNAFPEPEAQQEYTEREDLDSDYRKYDAPRRHKTKHVSDDYAAADLPASIQSQGEPVIIVNPRVHAWGAYTAEGKLLRSGLATAGASWCEDLGKPCRTKTGTFRLYSLGSEDCYSKKFPLGEGGAPMPYCMYFNGGQGIHGSNELAYDNLSHGCVRVSVEDAAWIRYHFAHINTKVVVESY